MQIGLAPFMVALAAPWSEEKSHGTDDATVRVSPSRVGRRWLATSNSRQSVHVLHACGSATGHAAPMVTRELTESFDMSLRCLEVRRSARAGRLPRRRSSLIFSIHPSLGSIEQRMAALAPLPNANGEFRYVSSLPRGPAKRESPRCSDYTKPVCLGGESTPHDRSFECRQSRHHLWHARRRLGRHHLRASSRSPVGTKATVTLISLKRALHPDEPSLSTFIVDYLPGGSAVLHRSPSAGYILVHVLSGTIRAQAWEAGMGTYRSGQTWVEPAVANDITTKNASAVEPARALVVLITNETSVLEPKDH
jgi:quercetin dioxygenase-like cupin family protein